MTTPENEIPTPEVTFIPANDYVLLRLDKRPTEILLPGTSKYMPSGVVAAVGRGLMTVHGWTASQFAPGDHVAIDSTDGLNFPQIPLSNDPDEVYAVVPESRLMGKLKNAGSGSPYMRNFAPGS